MIKLSNILQEIKLRPKKGWWDEWYNIWLEVMDDYGYDADTSEEDDEFLWDEDEINRETDELFRKKYGFDYNSLQEIKTINPNSLESLVAILNANENKVKTHLDEIGFLDDEGEMNWVFEPKYNLAIAKIDDYEIGFAFSYNQKDIDDSPFSLDDHDELKFKLNGKIIYWTTYNPE